MSPAASSLGPPGTRYWVQCHLRRGEGLDTAQVRPARDGRLYTYEEFCEYYGNTIGALEWNASFTTCTPVQCERNRDAPICRPDSNDPQHEFDGRLYTFQEFCVYFGKTMCRPARDGRLYTYEEFCEYYGKTIGALEWSWSYNWR